MTESARSPAVRNPSPVLRILCADGVVHYRFGQDVSTFKSLEVALEWADTFSATPGTGQMCGPHSIGEPVHV